MTSTTGFMFTDTGIAVHVHCCLLDAGIGVHVRIAEGWHDPRVQILRRCHDGIGVHVQVCPSEGSSPAHLAAFTRFDKVARSPCAHVNHIVG